MTTKSREQFGWFGDFVLRALGWFVALGMAITAIAILFFIAGLFVKMGLTLFGVE